MSPEQFDYLHEKIRPFITKSSLKRDSICSEERLSVTVRYLASGDSLMSLSVSYRMGLTSVHRIISETSLHIWQVLFEEGFLRAPKTPSEWVKIANEFERRWNFPDCCGTIDRKHIRMQAPPSSGSQFYNYKHFHSIVLLAVVWVSGQKTPRQKPSGHKPPGQKPPCQKPPDKPPRENL